MDAKTRAILRSMIAKEPCVAQVGKEGLTDTVIKGIESVLNARELIKVNVLKNSDLDIREVAEYVAKELDAEVVSVMGNKFVVYKKSKKNKLGL